MDQVENGSEQGGPRQAKLESKKPKHVYCGLGALELTRD